MLRLEIGLPLKGRITVADISKDDHFPSGLSISLDLRGRPLFYGESRTATVSDQGSFLIENVFLDDYTPRVTGLPDGFYVRSASQGGHDALSDAVRPGRGDLNLVLGSDGPVVSGQTLDGENRPVPDAAVVLMSEGGRISVRHSDQNGQYRFSSAISPGNYRLVALGGLYEGEEQDLDVVGANLATAAELNLSPRAVKTIPLTVHAVR